MRRTVSFVVWLTVGACSQAPIEPPPPKARTQELASALASALPAPDPKLARVPLPGRLALEAAARPERAVRPEQLFAALERRGVLLSRKRQVLASPIGASYCELSVSDSGLGVSVCEFADETARAAGTETSHRLFDAIVPGRTLIGHTNSLLTVTHPESDRAQKDATAVATSFATLSPVVRTP